MSVYAAEHDRRVFATLVALLGLADANQADLWRRQAQLPLRFAGLGLRNSARTAPAAYWASWADCLQPLTQRYPELGGQLLDYLTELEERAPPCVRAAQQAGTHLDAAGMQDRPGWPAVAGGARPRQPDREETEPGDWQHGWQFWAVTSLEQQEHQLLLSDLRGRGLESGAPGPARLRSCGGRNAAVWLTVCPTSRSLHLRNAELLTALRLRLGLPVPQEGARCEGCRAALDPLGYHRLTCTRTARLHTRHRELVNAWRQVLVEAGGAVPRRNVERLLRDCNVRVDTALQRRLDLVVSNLSVARGLPLLCDVTCVAPVTGAGMARAGCLTVDGGAVEAAARHCHTVDYPEVARSNTGRLYCLGVEVFGRWAQEALALVRDLARERVAGLPARVRLGTHQRLLRRWWGLLGMATQRAVARAVLQGSGADLAETLVERPPGVADLPGA